MRRILTGAGSGKGSSNKYGYGYVLFEGRQRFVHRLTYSWAKGPIPRGYVIHHKCRVPACVRPSHLRKMTWAAHAKLHRSNPTHCPKGHRYTEKDFDYRGWRRCLKCKRLTDRQHYHSMSNRERNKERIRVRDAQRRRRQDPEKRERMLEATRQWRERVRAER